MFTENHARGGGNRYMIDLINALRSDYDEVCIASNAGGIFPEDVRRLSRPVEFRKVNLTTRASISCSFHRLPVVVRRVLFFPLVILKPLFLLYNIALLAKLLRNVKPTHVLSCNGGYPAAQACLSMVFAAKLSSVPVVLSIVSMPTRRRAIMWPYEKLIDKLIWSSADVVVVNALAVAEALRNLREAVPEKIKLVYNGLDDRQPGITAIKDDGKFTIGCIARMDAAKGVLFLFEAFSYLASRHPELELVLAGQGDASDEIARRTRSYGLQNQVRLLGHYDGDVCALLETFDVFVLPSLWEGFPYSIVEALRSACTIVATAVGGVPEAVRDGVDGLLIEPGSTEQIIEALEKLMANREMRLILARNGRMRFERELTLPVMHMRVRETFAALPRGLSD